MSMGITVDNSALYPHTVSGKCQNGPFYGF